MTFEKTVEVFGITLQVQGNYEKYAPLIHNLYIVVSGYVYYSFKNYFL